MQIAFSVTISRKLNATVTVSQQTDMCDILKNKMKTAANSLARGFLKLNLLIPLINF